MVLSDDAAPPSQALADNGRVTADGNPLARATPSLRLRQRRHKATDNEMVHMRFKQSMRVGLLLALAVPAVGLTARDSPAEAPSPLPAQAAAPAFGASNSKPATPRTYPCAKKVKEAFRDGRGVEHREAAADRAKVTTFDDSAGTRWTEVMPPAGFDPLQATDEQLEAFGFEARPCRRSRNSPA